MTFEDLQAMSKGSAPKTKNPVKIGFFKLADNGDEALIRFDVESVKDLSFASVHQLGADTKWMKVLCPSAGGKLEHHCPLCDAAKTNKSISTAKNKVYVKALVAYKDTATGQFSAAQPVVWERPALVDYQGNPKGFLAKLTNLLKDFGNLKDTVFKVTRNGAANDKKTDYDITFIPTYNKPELVPVDFSAFDNFDISKHSYWVKTEEEMQAYLDTGAFPAYQKADSAAEDAPATTYSKPAAKAEPEVTVDAKDPDFETPAPKATTASSNKFSGFDF